jgi:hypothetical protein
VLGYTQMALGNNSLTLRDFVYNDVNGNAITFLHPNGSKEKFLAALNSTTSLRRRFSN